MPKKLSSRHKEALFNFFFYYGQCFVKSFVYDTYIRLLLTKKSTFFQFWHCYFEFTPGDVDGAPPLAGDVQHIHLTLGGDGIVAVQVVPIGAAVQAAPVGVYAVGEHPGSQIRYAGHGGAAPWRWVGGHRGGHPTGTFEWPENWLSIIGK